MKTRLNVSRSNLSGRNSLKQVNSKLEKNLQKLSTGKRINSAGDDAAGLSIASSLRARIKSSSRALRNANDAVSFIQIAEGSLNTINDALVRLRELSIKNGSDTLTDGQRMMTNKEYRSLISEIQRVVHSTKLFNKKMLDGTLGDMTIQVGIQADKNNQIKIDTRMFSNTIHALGIFDIDASTRMKSIKSLRKIDYAITEVARARSYYGSIQSVLQAAAGDMSHQIANKMTAHSQIMDADVAKQTAEAAHNTIVKKSGIAMQAQTKDTIRQAARVLKDV